MRGASTKMFAVNGSKTTGKDVLETNDTPKSPTHDSLSYRNRYGDIFCVMPPARIGVASLTEDGGGKCCGAVTRPDNGSYGRAGEASHLLGSKGAPSDPRQGSAMFLVCRECVLERLQGAAPPLSSSSRSCVVSRIPQPNAQRREGYPQVPNTFGVGDSIANETTYSSTIRCVEQNYIRCPVRMSNKTCTLCVAIVYLLYAHLHCDYSKDYHL